MTEGVEMSEAEVKKHWETMHPLAQIRTFENLFLFPSFLDKEGLGTASVLCESGIFGESKERKKEEVCVSVRMTVDEQGNVVLSTSLFSGFIKGQAQEQNRRDVRGFPINKDGLRLGLEKELRELPDISRIDYNVGNPKKYINPALRFNMLGHSAEIAFILTENGYQNPMLTFHLQESSPLEEQIERFLTLSMLMFTVISQLDPESNIQISSDNKERLIQDFQTEIDRNLKRIKSERLQEYLKRSAALKKVLEGERDKYEEKLQVMEEKRQGFLDSAEEPAFKDRNFPFVEMARFDFAHQMYLSEDESEQDTMALHRVMDDLGITLDERVMRRHLVNLAEVKADGENLYELLTANPKRVAMKSGSWRNTRMSVGTTHNDIGDTYYERNAEGATYNLTKNPAFTDADKRGVVFETESGKLYAVWGLAQTWNLRSGAVALKEVEHIDQELSPKLFDDMSKRYELVLLSGEFATELLEKIVCDEFTNSAAIIRINELNAPLNFRNWIRSRLMIRASLPVEEKDLEP